jgi:hypothetical protein
MADLADYLESSSSQESLDFLAIQKHRATEAAMLIAVVDATSSSACHMLYGPATRNMGFWVGGTPELSTGKVLSGASRDMPV